MQSRKARRAGRSARVKKALQGNRIRRCCRCTTPTNPQNAQYKLRQHIRLWNSSPSQHAHRVWMNWSGRPGQDISPKLDDGAYRDRLLSPVFRAELSDSSRAIWTGLGVHTHRDGVSGDGGPPSGELILLCCSGGQHASCTLGTTGHARRWTSISH